MRMRGFVAALVVGAGLWSGVAVAASEPAGLLVARGNACMGCHAVDRKLVGPGFQQIAARYKGDPLAQKKLEAKVRDGGAGVWGVIPMPAHPRMSDSDVRTVVQWVLIGAPSE
ncbi:MAG TPA: c-type cytochrome [Trinickia sp.]|uniref:c-type cytochrome n=1 Tax=Trinickia sp. TaxID=2571163 RepID=UPI002B6F1891|nr:c-type cytochrome [Trinickia sp.]HTI19221.1 c-type cytochrome [Trinickia sp.]